MLRGLGFIALFAVDIWVLMSELGMRWWEAALVNVFTLVLVALYLRFQAATRRA